MLPLSGMEWHLQRLAAMGRSVYRDPTRSANQRGFDDAETDFNASASRRTPKFKQVICMRWENHPVAIFDDGAFLYQQTR